MSAFSLKKFKHSNKAKEKSKETEFQVVRASIVLSIPPIFSISPKSGAAEMLDSMIMRYIPAFQGVVLSHTNLQFLEKQASIKADCPFLVSKISFDATVWRPRVGMKLVGKINLCSPDHISLLVHKTFNVSIPRHHIPTEKYAFEYGPAEDGIATQEEGAEEEVEKETQSSGGRWLNNTTDAWLGEPDGHLEFTVVGLTVANEMLSLLGSIQPDPFSSSHVPAAKASETSDAEKVDNQLRELTPAGDENEDFSDDDEDTFVALGRQADNARQRAAEAERQKNIKEGQNKRRTVENEPRRKKTKLR